MNGKLRGFWVIDCSEDSSSILYHSKGLIHQKTVGWHWSSLPMQLTCYLSIVLIMVSEFIPCMSCELSYLACCMRFEVRAHTNTKQRDYWLGYFGVLFSPHVSICWSFWYTQWCQGWGSCKGLAARAMMHDAVQCSVVSHCAHPTMPVDIWARCNSVSWDNNTLVLVVWIGFNSWLLQINLWINSQATKLSYFCVETYTMY